MTAAAEVKWTPAGEEFMRGLRVDHKSEITWERIGPLLDFQFLF